MCKYCYCHCSNLPLDLILGEALFLQFFTFQFLLLCCYHELTCCSCLLDKEGIGKSESFGLKMCERGYMYIRLLHLLLFCVFQSDIMLVHKSTFLGCRSNFYPILSTESNVHISYLFYSPKHTKYLSRATGLSVASNLAAEIMLFCIVFVRACCW